MDYLLSDSLKISDNQLLNMSTLSDSEKKFIAKIIRGLKECQADLINAIQGKIN